LKEWHRIGRDLIRILRLKTSPVAVKLLRTDEFPPKAKRPTKDLKIKIAMCQAWGMARRLKWTIAISPRENTCLAASILFGWVDLKEKKKDEDIYKELAKSLSELGYLRNVDAATRSVDAYYKFRMGEYCGLAVSPLESTKITPDIVMVYCDSAQAVNLVHGSIFDEGGCLKFSCQARGTCSEAIIPTVLTGKPQLTIPCTGDRAYAGTEDYELVFTTPASKVGDVVQLLRQRIREDHFTIPVYKNLSFQPIPSETYRKLEKKITYVE
jgi:uncharacterized protein (DUF169 family)